MSGDWFLAGCTWPFLSVGPASGHGLGMGHRRTVHGFNFRRSLPPPRGVHAPVLGAKVENTQSAAPAGRPRTRPRGEGGEYAVCCARGASTHPSSGRRWRIRSLPRPRGVHAPILVGKVEMPSCCLQEMLGYGRQGRQEAHEMSEGVLPGGRRRDDRVGNIGAWTRLEGEPRGKGALGAGLQHGGL